MSGSFSLVEKLAVAGAFCAIVAMAVGTESDPGVIVASQTKVAAAPTKMSPGRAASVPAASYWNLSPGAAPMAEPLPPPPENLPPGFGARPPADLPM